MERLFINIFQMSISASYLILAVLVVRFLLRRAPKSMRGFLWLLVGIRLLIPFSVESVFSLIPNTQVVDESIYDTVHSEMNTISNTAIINPSVNQPILDTFIPSAQMRVGKTQAAVLICTKIWLAGMALMFGYMLASWLRLKNRVKMSIPVDIALHCGHTEIYQRIYQNNAIESPFLFGIIKPRIYVPNGIADEELPYVVQHEMTHLKRRDYLIKPAGFLLLSVYWFNPCVWTAYIMLCKDIELICDEKVIKQLGASCKKAYSQALLNSVSSRRMIAACPVAFGEVSVKERVKNVLNYKKPAFWVLAAAVLACIIVPVCFMTQKKSDSTENTDNLENAAVQGESLSETLPAEEYNIDDLFTIAGCYEMLNPEDYQNAPRLLLEKDGKFSFTYSVFSSYLPYGTYELKDDLLTATTDDGKYQYQFKCVGAVNNSLLFFDAEHSSDVTNIDTKTNFDAPVNNGSIFIKNGVFSALTDARDLSQTLNQELAQGTAMTIEELHAKQVSLAEMRKQLTMGEMNVQWQLEKVKELHLTQEESAALEARLQELIQETQAVMQQLEKDLDACQSMINAVEDTQMAYNMIEQWARAFCDRDGAAIVRLADEKIEQKLVNNDILIHGFDGKKDYLSFGWSSPWPWGGNYDEDGTEYNYRIINVTNRTAEILYYAWTSDPHVTVWRELLTYSIKNDTYVITSETLDFMDEICIADEFYRAYPDGITGTMMDYYSYNGAGEALNDNAKKNRDSQWYNKLFEPGSAAVYLLNILDNPNKAGIHVTKSDTDTSTCTVTFEFYEDGSSASVQMIQPYGSDGIWVPYTEHSDVLEDTASIAPYIITSENVDDIMVEDARQLEALFPDHHEFAFNAGADLPQMVDLNGDGIEEKIELVNLLYNGGDGGYALRVTDTATGQQIPLPDGYTEESGFPIFTSYINSEEEEPRLLIQIGEEKRCSVIATILQGPLFRIYERNHMYFEVKNQFFSNRMIFADALSGYNIITYKNEQTPVLLLKTYISGYAGHADTLGYVITELRLQQDNTWASRHYFLLDSCDDPSIMQLFLGTTP